jgi:3-phosphoshikimate 1-carboxyvinyltransferase
MIQIMKIAASRAVLSGSIRVPGSKSHTIRAVILASLAEGVSHISNPLASADCLSAGRAVPLIGSRLDFGDSGSADSVWTVTGAGSGAHLPSDVIDVGNSGSLLYFLSPIVATFPGWSIFTGDESIRKRPVSHVVAALNQLGAQAFIARPGTDAPPLLIRGPIDAGHTVITDGRLSQYVSGMMMAALRMNGTLRIELTDPKEVPYLKMTRQWLEFLGTEVFVSDDFRHIRVSGPVFFKGFDRIIPSDWEAVAFPLIAALITDSELVIENIDDSGSQGDAALLEVLLSVGADVEWNHEMKTLTVRGGSRARSFAGRGSGAAASDILKACSVPGRLSTKGLPGGELHANLAGFPDAVCALAAVACFIDGKTVIEDIGVCRRKETDRIVVLKGELSKLGAEVEEGEDFLVINGHSPLLPDGNPNPAFRMHGGSVESFGDHRVAMAEACLGLGLPDLVVVNDAECCSVSFPHFFEAMNRIGAEFTKT